MSRCKVLFVSEPGMAQVGLALATSIGAWVNLLLVLWFAARAGLIEFDAALKRAVLKIAAAGMVLALALWLTAGRSPVCSPIGRRCATKPHWRCSC